MNKIDTMIQESKSRFVINIDDMREFNAAFAAK